jgi:hypothetical protein
MNCDPIARWYRPLEYLVFGRALERRRFAFLEEAAKARRVLMLGEGDGRFIAEFVKRNPLALVDCVELSHCMLALAHFFLDCFTVAELEGLVARISARCRPGARWLASEFCLPETGLRRAAAWALIRIMYLFFRITTGLKVKRLPDYAPVLAANGFRIVRRCSEVGALLVSELWERTP